MNLSVFQEKFEKEFENDIKPSFDFYTNIKTYENRISYSLDLNQFYIVSPPTNIGTVEKGVKVDVEKNSIKTLYLSYLTLNNKFAEVPEDSFVDIEENCGFYLDLDLELYGNIEVIPYIIFYNDEGKDRMTKITIRNQLISYKNSDKKLRLTFKLKGAGTFYIKNISRIDLGVD